MSIYKDKKRGTYYVSFSQKDISTGKFKHVTKRGFLTSKEAKQWERVKTYTHLLSQTDQEMMFKINEYRSPSETKSETNEIKNQKIPRVGNSEKVRINSMV